MRRELVPFKFKQFNVSHSKSTIPVGTDAVLLGAWVEVGGVKKALDVGTGTGVIALCLTQRCETLNQCHALDLDFQSVLEACDNFDKSPWKSLFTAFHVSFGAHKLGAYDLIVSNPPFFRDSLLNKKQFLEKARHQTGFEMGDYALFCKEKLSHNGTVAIVYPARDLQYLEQVFHRNGFFTKRLCTVYSKRTKEPSRVLVEFCLVKSKTEKEVLIIYDECSNYTPDYKDLTKEFYLNF